MTDSGNIPRLGDYRKDASQLAPAAFVAAHAPAFLLHHGPLGTLRVAPQDKGTLVGQPPAGSRHPFRPHSDFLVFPLRATRPDADITVGRGAINDVVIPEATVSVYHAVVRIGSDGRYFLQDCSSKNGTLCNDRPVPTQDQGGWSPIGTGDRIHFGTLDMTFLEADQFRQLVISLLDEED